MKALTICQPYAHLIMTGAKLVENRTWPTKYRGLLAIHAGKSRLWLDDPNEYETLADAQAYVNYGVPLSRMAFGCVVAVARLVDCLDYFEIMDGKHDAKYPWIRKHQHTSGPWCYVLQGAVPVGPWPWRGAQGLFEINDEQLDQVATRLTRAAESEAPTAHNQS